MDIKSFWLAPYKIRYMDSVLRHLLNSPKHSSTISELHQSINVKRNMEFFDKASEVGHFNFKSDIDFNVIIDDVYLRDILRGLFGQNMVDVDNDGNCKLLMGGVLKITNNSFTSEYFHNKYDKTFKIIFGLISIAGFGLGIYSSFYKK